MPQVNWTRANGFRPANPPDYAQTQNVYQAPNANDSPWSDPSPFDTGNPFAGARQPSADATYVGQAQPRPADQSQAYQAPDTNWYNPSDPRGSFSNLVQGRDPSSDTLRSLEAVLKQAGISLENPNAAGITSKIVLPGGQRVRVGGHFDSAPSEGFPMTWEWVGQDGGGGGYEPAQAAPAANTPSASTDLYVNEILTRLAELRKPIEDPFQKLYQALALARVNDLNAAPFTAGEDAALRAQYMEPLTQARDQQRRDAIDRLGARNIGPSSGLYQQQAYSNVDRNYDQGLAGATNDMAVRAINEKQAREERQLGILMDLVNNAGNTRAEDSARGREIVSTAQLLPNLDTQRLSSLLAASNPGSSTGDASDILRMLTGLNINQQNRDDQSRQATAAMWGSLLPYFTNIFGGGGAL